MQAQNNTEKENSSSSLSLDYSIEEPEERVKLVEKIIEQTPPDKLNNRYL